MAVKIRLRRTGKKKEVHYRVVVSEAATSIQGSFIDSIGYVNPRQDPPKVDLDEEKVRLWLSRGAQPTETVRSIFVKAGLMDAKPVEITETAKSALESVEPEAKIEAVPAEAAEAAEPVESVEAVEPETETAVEPETEGSETQS